MVGRTLRSRFAIVATVISVFVFFSYVLLPSRRSSPLSSSSPHSSQSDNLSFTYNNDFPTPTPDGTSTPLPPLPLHVHPTLLHGDAIMPKLGNETAKQELGRAAWKVVHTTLARFPIKPSKDEREALSSYLLLFARLYPCGECAKHFVVLLREFPPQTSSRDAASQWGCYIHNHLNERLQKPIFDCGTVTETYQCGCADSDAAAAQDSVTTEEHKSVGVGLSGEPVVDVFLEENARRAAKGARVEIERAGLVNGG